MLVHEYGLLDYALWSMDVDSMTFTELGVECSNYSVDNRYEYLRSKT